MTIKMYAIANCDTVKKARASLEKRKIEYEFIDFKKTPPTTDLIKRWQEFFGDIPVNKKGITYKKYKDEFEALDSKGEIDFLIKNNSMIKRPILEKNDQTFAVGFDEKIYESLKN